VGIEACDDGNQNQTDACLNDCTAARCGDTHLRAGIEACDDGNRVQTDACLNTCVVAACGDGHVRAGVEACDDGNQAQTDACTNACVVARCGDGLVHAGVEACDDANQVNNDTCANDCTATSVHNTVAFVGANTAGGCSYDDAHAFRWDNLGNMSWIACAIEASKRGASMTPGQYSVELGWYGHRKGSNAMTGVWATYRQAPITNPIACVVGRDGRSNTRAGTLNSRIDYDGHRWRYQDYGLRHFDECFLLAANAGANIITPYTIGQTGDNYWVHSPVMCNGYAWITSNGTSFLPEAFGVGARSTRHSCMVGYIDY
jgi:cysteine-rich repeat protein